jgi:ABC-type Fe3+-siderophore transport system permease subunit
MDVRLPRLLAGLLIGAGLSISGASFQGLFRNPFVSPHILGVSAGAGFGEVIQELSGKGMTIIMASHFPDHAFLVAQTAAILTNGRIFQMGTPDEVITEANMKAAYGVDVRIVRAGGDDNRKVLIPALKTA